MSAPLPRRLVLLGHPVAHSLSPAFQNAALQAAGMALSYETLDVLPAALGDTLAQLRADGAAGNVTIPHKVSVAARCDRLTARAARVGAVNTFWHDERDQLVGDNTDVEGFRRMARGLDALRPDVVVACLGAGGSAAAVCAAMEGTPGVTVRVWSRRAAQARVLATRFAPVAQAFASAEHAVAGAHVVVNATPVGLTDDRLPIAVSALSRDACVMDLVYRRGETRWVREAREARHVAADGREMLLHQGAQAFEGWFGRPADLAAMRRALEQALG